mmetsp:Transcript_1880/g.2773  ORF Transcript_1880/g.2773 Transcript_1880/m.2773 type:complete len:201 (-) Transcript_1880:1402-2004(-)|eukprot:CAMPEP_0175042604 /NCGR_PEP_ID=MMETSP0052_2-20121109/2673_1 /TAXON_ID=51329 ORGANISM="Polytomella parva, Strain SAG 63-3" /NCGR_SAMPLE_ID=MMETSP0052_2 /ASSEMBLY_ACC=CAM_ASM_000194 /LENGTH=200 /DNA_ID=CAMNT_0016305469 /DNA_START=28 /DNA_END=630 /DNA_ORIENTATION=-
MIDNLIESLPELWVFGYGSLMHTPSFKFSRKVTGYIRNYRRVFYQGSTDHRGTVENPGRTVTLEVSEGSMTWGVAFKLSGCPEEQRKTLEYLEWREKQYDLRALVDVYSTKERVGDAGLGVDGIILKNVLVYIATPDITKNVNYLGPASLEALAQQIAICRGPSGPNYEYLFKIADVVRDMNIEDEDLFVLEDLVKKLLN